MIDSQVGEFMQVFRSVTAVFPVRGDVGTLSASYFQALKRFPLGQVELGAERAIQQLTRFPKPAEWAELIPRQSASPTILELSATERSEHLEAEAFHYEQPPCGCERCRAAGVSGRPVRYVPDVGDPPGRIGDRIVTRGHWAHGTELLGYYRAKAAFWATARRLGHGKMLALVGREVGCEG